jgi:protein Tex
MENFILSHIHEKLNIPFKGVKNTISLLAEGATIPFIARYRKEFTDGLDEVEVKAIQGQYQYFTTLQDRKKTILNSIEEQGKLTPELKEAIEKALDASYLEELYLPYKQKRKTKASIAIENGLEPLADLIMENSPMGDKFSIVGKFLNDKVQIRADAIEGAQYIIAERLSLDLEHRETMRIAMLEEGFVVSKAKKQAEPHKDTAKFEIYFEFEEKVSNIKPHQVLALNRGEKLGILNVTIDAYVDKVEKSVHKKLKHSTNGIFTEEFNEAVDLAVQKYIYPSIENEVRGILTDKSDEHAIKTFSTNLRNLLLQAPVHNKVVLGIDPGFASGCKVAVVDRQGNYKEGNTIYPVPPKNEFEKSRQIVLSLIEKHKVDIIAIGNGTASRETEQFISNLISQERLAVKYIIVNEAGASVYSASDVAREEFPKIDATQRGNISIARRLQDPLAELVKIDPKSIGVGLYQHDVNQKALEDELALVVESCVNHVGVDINTASASLLSYVSGLSSKQAKSIIEFRGSIKQFNNRKQLKEVSGIGEKAYEQCAGFLRILDGEEPLDNTSIHPESYDSLKKIAKVFNIEYTQFATLAQKMASMSLAEKQKIQQETGIGEHTLKLIIENLTKPGRDPREELNQPMFRSDVLKIEDLKNGMKVQGTVRNVVDFGAFVDIGLKNDALLHISRMGQRFVKNPHDVLGVGDILEVEIADIDLGKGRVGLAMSSN